MMNKLEDVVTQNAVKAAASMKQTEVTDFFEKSNI